MRDKRIDILRFIGLSMIILAHVGTSGFIFQARNFDVPLMVVVAGISYRLSHKEEPYFIYLIKRLQRLVLPVWLFLSLYFICIIITGHPNIILNYEIALSSYLLLGGIGYVWIIRVFILVACTSPFIYNISSKINSNVKFLVIILITYAAYEFIYSITIPNNSNTIGFIFEQTILYALPYSVLFALGLRISEFSKRLLLTVASLALMTFFIIAIYLYLTTGNFLQTQNFKYPPRIYYLSYSIFIIVSTWMGSQLIIKLFDKIKISKYVFFIAQNSIWIYLWHIPFVEIFILPFYTKYLLVYGVATAITFLQVYIVHNKLLPRTKSYKTKRNLELLFTG
jgi:fucose 4-O-acetylase-like acetyltransferase